MFDKLIVILVCMGMYHAQGEGKVAAANTEIIESPYFKYGTQNTGSLKGQFGQNCKITHPQQMY